MCGDAVLFAIGAHVRYRVSTHVLLKAGTLSTFSVVTLFLLYRVSIDDKQAPGIYLQKHLYRARAIDGVDVLHMTHVNRINAVKYQRNPRKENIPRPADTLRIHESNHLLHTVRNCFLLCCIFCAWVGSLPACL